MQKNAEKSSKIVSAIFIVISVVVFVFVVVYQQLKYPTNLKISDEEIENYQNQQEQIKNTAEKVEQKYKKVVPLDQQYTNTTLSEEQLEDIKEDLTESFEKLEKYAAYKYSSINYDTPCFTEDIENFQTESLDNLKTIQQQVIKYPIGTVIPLIQFYNKQNLKDFVNLDEPIKEYQGIYYIPLIGQTITITKNILTQIPDFCELMGYTENQQVIIPNSYNCVLRQNTINNENKISNGCISIDINNNLSHLTNNQSADLEIVKRFDERNNDNGIQGITSGHILYYDGGSGMSGTQNEDISFYVNATTKKQENLKDLKYTGIDSITKTQYPKKYCGGERKYTPTVGYNYGGSQGSWEVCRSLSKQDIAGWHDTSQGQDKIINRIDWGGSLSVWDGNTVYPQKYYPTTNKQTTQLNILNNYINSIYVMIVGYV